MKKGNTKSVEAHCANKKFGMGDYYGTGIKNPVCKIRDWSSPGSTPVKPIALKKPPRSIA